MYNQTENGCHKTCTEDGYEVSSIIEHSGSFPNSRCDSCPIIYSLCEYFKLHASQFYPGFLQNLHYVGFYNRLNNRNIIREKCSDKFVSTITQYVDISTKDISGFIHVKGPTNVHVNVPGAGGFINTMS